MNFSKLQGAGNDFILVDAREMKQDWQKLAQSICHRHFGIGADGLILVQNSNTADLKMRIFNPDGFEAEACGNGLRCIIKYAIEKGIASTTNLNIETISGIRKAKAHISGNKVSLVDVSMGRPQFQPEQIPITFTQPPPIKRGVAEEIEVKQPQMISDYPLVLEDRKLTLSVLSMGNPHAVSFLSVPVNNFPLAKVGPQVERHTMFPRGTNFEIARVLSKGDIEARVWERGAGETLACGSGACAIAVAAQLLGHIDKKVDIILPGGTLTVFWDRVGEVLLTGPVEEVFSGEYFI